MDAVLGAQWATAHIRLFAGPDPTYTQGADVALFDFQHHLPFNDNGTAGYKLGYQAEWFHVSNSSVFVHP